ncbi:MAG: 50S ribosomal protein L10 [Bacteroidales bacterium]|nr:50S ribosomal protein L10 [Bacteroidales bacterium]MDD7698258.1 50S ribosomal protein L10 [Spirochaetia bacterium]MDY4173935.1 50S ribosomal protein L10 [Bacteroidales bacterium]
MRKEDKATLIDQLVETLKSYNHFYLVDIEGLNAEKTSALRRLCFEKEIKLMVVKNTLIKKAINSVDGELQGLDHAFEGNTAVMFSNVGNVPAKVIKQFAADNEKPVLKGAYVENSVYGPDALQELVAIKSKEELIADVIALLQSPAKNVVSALQGSAGNKIHGILETLSKK